MPEQPDGGEQQWLTGTETAGRWRIRTDHVRQVASRTGVRHRTFGGGSRGTYGAAPTFHDYQQEDVERTAADLAEGRVEVPAAWRVDTPEGRRAEWWSRFWSKLGCVALTVVALGGGWCSGRWGRSSTTPPRTDPGSGFRHDGPGIVRRDRQRLDPRRDPAAVRGPNRPPDAVRR